MRESTSKQTIFRHVSDKLLTMRWLHSSTILKNSIAICPALLSLPTSARSSSRFQSFSMGKPNLSPVASGRAPGSFFESSQCSINTDKALARDRWMRSTSNPRSSTRDGWRVVIGRAFRAFKNTHWPDLSGTYQPPRHGTQTCEHLLDSRIVFVNSRLSVATSEPGGEEPVYTWASSRENGYATKGSMIWGPLLVRTEIKNACGPAEGGHRQKLRLGKYQGLA